MTHETIGSGGQIVLAVVKLLILITGGAVTFFAYKAYDRTRELIEELDESKDTARHSLSSTSPDHDRDRSPGVGGGSAAGGDD